MTLNDFLKRVDIKKDGDKMLLHCEIFVDDGEFKVAWSNLDIDIRDNEIRLLPNINNSPFLSDK